MDGDDYGRLIYLSLLLVAVAGWGFSEYRGRMGQGLRAFLAWGLIVLGLMAGYGLWQDIRHDVMPMQRASASAIEIPRAMDGHYYITLTVAGQPLTFMADTGATGVVLSKSDAARLGIDLADLVFAGQSQTANGIVRTARVRLDDVSLGPFHDASIGAFVNEGDMDGSLLGMEYLGRYSIEISGDRMILRR
ncbi:retropepsin-like aspartic protease family protein [Tabrizicola sp.]|uniref:retropepsin-like aspartic protease family protein n=1 Tax=Tabrizicola sp. TaxID=2005166 RepID=UPI003D2B0B06